AQGSRGKTRDVRPIHPPPLQPPPLDDFRAFGLRALSPMRGCLVSGSCSSDQGFASSFLPTDASRRRRCSWLGVPVTRVSRGLAPPRRFPVGFRLPVAGLVGSFVRYITSYLLGRMPCPAHTQGREGAKTQKGPEIVR